MYDDYGKRDEELIASLAGMAEDHKRTGKIGPRPGEKPFSAADYMKAHENGQAAALGAAIESLLLDFDTPAEVTQDTLIDRADNVVRLFPATPRDEI